MNFTDDDNNNVLQRELRFEGKEICWVTNSFVSIRLYCFGFGYWLVAIKISRGVAGKAEKGC